VPERMLVQERLEVGVAGGQASDVRVRIAPQEQAFKGMKQRMNATPVTMSVRAGRMSQSRHAEPSGVAR